MQRSQLAKYKIGLLVVGIFTVAMLVMVLVQASATKQDIATDKIANGDADKLNTYTEQQYAVPETLRQVGITQNSSNISYTKLSDNRYKFCVTYKAASSNFDPSAVAGDLATGGSSFDWSTDTTSDSYLYIPTSHHKGANCQTIDTGGGLNYGGGGLCGAASGSAYIACMQPDSGSSSPILGSGSSEADTERETDINALDSHLEAYYAENGDYPTYGELNSASWRSTNMLGLDGSALCDPSTTTKENCALATDSKKGSYSYYVTDANKTNCTDEAQCTNFTLTAMLSAGTRYTKQSLE